MRKRRREEQAIRVLLHAEIRLVLIRNWRKQHNVPEQFFTAAAQPDCGCDVWNRYAAGMKNTVPSTCVPSAHLGYDESGQADAQLPCDGANAIPSYTIESLSPYG